MAEVYKELARDPLSSVIAEPGLHTTVLTEPTREAARSSRGPRRTVTCHQAPFPAVLAVALSSGTYALSVDFLNAHRAPSSVAGARDRHWRTREDSPT